MQNETYPKKAFILLIGCFLAWASPLWSQNFSVENQPGGLLVLENGKKVLFFQKETKSLDGQYPRANYIHPLYDFREEALTEDFPADHLHHRGIFWTWHQILLHEEQVADGWECKDMVWQVKKLKSRIRPAGIQLQTKVNWETPLTPGEKTYAAIVRESAAITIHPTVNGLRILDFTIDLKALKGGLAIGGSEDEKGYSGFSLRLRLPEDIRFYDAEKELIPQTQGIAAGPWIDIRGSLSAEDDLGIALFCHPRFPEKAQPWILRNKNSMQNPAFPGREPVVLAKGKTLRLKYRLVLHEGQQRMEELEKLYQQFIEEEK